MQLRRAGQAAGDAAAEKKIRRQLTGVAKFAARLGFASPTAYEDWLARGAPEEELPLECRHVGEAPLIDDESAERLQLRSDAAIAKLRHVSTSVVTAERKRVEQPQARAVAGVHVPQVEPEAPIPEAPRSLPPRRPQPVRRSTWEPLHVQPADEPFEDPFARGGRSGGGPQRRYWTG